MSAIGEVVTNAVVTGCTYALVALGFSWVYAVTRSFHFAHAGVYTSGAYLYYFSVKTCGLVWWLAAAIAIVGASAIGGAIERGIYSRLRSRGASSVAILVASLGTLVFLQNGISLAFGDASKSVRGAEVSKVLSLGPVSLTPVRFWTVVATLAVFVATWLIFRRTGFGKKTRAVANDPDLSIAVGIDRDWVILIANVVGSGLAALAAILQSYDTDINPTMGFNVLLMAVVATVVGGIGSTAGVVLGGLLVGTCQCVGVWLLPGHWQDTVVFAVLVGFLLLRPTGFSGSTLRSAEV